VHGPYHLPAKRLRIEEDDGFARELPSGFRSGGAEVPSHGLDWIAIRRGGQRTTDQIDAPPVEGVGVPGVPTEA
jgi:hypothetical protein